MQIMHHTAQNITAGHTLLDTNVLLLCYCNLKGMFLYYHCHLVFLDESQSWFKTTSVHVRPITFCLHCIHIRRTKITWFLALSLTNWAETWFTLFSGTVQKRKLILHYCPVFVIKGIAHKEHIEQIEIWCFFEFFFTLFLFLILDFRAVV